MKHLMTGLMLMSLAACSGGGSNSGPGVPPPTQQPPVPQGYTASLTWQGAMHTKGTTALSTARRVQSGTATPEPVQVAAQPCMYSQNPQCGNYLFQQGNSIPVTVTAAVNPSPSPSAAPATWTIPSSPLPVQTASPDASAPPNSIKVISTSATGNTTITATIPLPSATPSVQAIPMYVYPTIAIGCNVPPGGGNQGFVHGYVLTNGSATASNDPTQADVYIDGPACSDSFVNASESTATIHFPGGAVFFSQNTTDFFGVAASGWSNAFTSIAMSDWTSQTGYPSSNSMIEFKTRLGQIAKVFFNGAYGSPAPGQNTTVDLAFDMSGYSVTGANY